MTTHEIIDETIEWYSNNPRSKGFRDSGAETCKYFGAGGANCAFSRCCDLSNPEVVKLLEKMDNDSDGGALSDFSSEVDFSENLDFFFQDLLDANYRDHLIEFWASLQKLHDTDHFWTTGKLSDDGLSYAKRLKVTFPIA
jgi:hypothetical protein